MWPSRAGQSGHGSRQPVRQLFWCEGLVEGLFVIDIVLDTSFSRTLVRNDLVREKSCGMKKTVTVPETL